MRRKYAGRTGNCQSREKTSLADLPRMRLGQQKETSKAWISSTLT